MAARMDSQKDYRTYIAALRLLVEKGIHWSFIALGEGNLRESLKKEAQDLIGLGLMMFPDPAHEVLPYVRRASVGVLMTTEAIHAEGISNAIMEYMACGLPVICGDSGGNRELVVDGHTGFIIQSGNPQALADKLLWLWGHPTIARNMGLAGKERIYSEFSLEGMVSRTLAVYQEVIGKYGYPQ